MNRENRPLGNGRCEDAAFDEAELEAVIFSLPQRMRIPLHYRLPRWLDTLEEHQRAYMQDLPQLSEFRLWQEEVRATVALAFCDMDDPKHQLVARWLKWRLTAIHRERSRRRAQAG